MIVFECAQTHSSFVADGWAETVDDVARACLENLRAAQGGATVLDIPPPPQTYVEPARSHISQTVVSFERSDLQKL